MARTKPLLFKQSGTRLFYSNHKQLSIPLKIGRVPTRLSRT